MRAVRIELTPLGWKPTPQYAIPALIWRRVESTILTGEPADRLAGDAGHPIDGILVEVPYDVTFAFAFHAFRDGSPIHGAKPAAAPK